MDKGPSVPDLDKLRLADEHDDDTEDLFASPSTSGATTQKHTPSSAASSAHKRSNSRRNEQEARDARLRAELERIREVNRVIEGVTTSLTKARGNMETVNRTVQNASTLLATWTRILGQTEHNQRLILNPNWHGATQDLEDMESEELRRQQEAERRAMEEQRRREDAQRRAEEEERKKAAAAAAPTRGLGRSRSVRGTSSSTRGSLGLSSHTGRGRGTTSTRGTTGLGRSSSTRGRGRGVG